MFAKSTTAADNATQPSLFRQRTNGRTEMRIPWVLKTSTVLAKLFGKALVQETWIKPNGEEEVYGMIEQKDWVVVLGVTTDNQVIVVNEFKPGRSDFGDELPAGTSIGSDDTWNKIAMRALQNEAGHSAGELINLGKYFMATRNSHTKVSMVLALRCVQDGEPAAKEAEEIKWRLEPLTTWVTRVQTGEITEWSAALCTLRALAVGALKHKP